MRTDNMLRIPAFDWAVSLPYLLNSNIQIIQHPLLHAPRPTPYAQRHTPNAP